VKLIVKILVRSRKDANAVKAVLERHPETSHWIIETLGGNRGYKLENEIQQLLEPFTLVLLGREDIDVYENIRDLEDQVPFTSIILGKTKKIRNSTLEMIHALLTKGRTIIRMKTKWYTSYILSGYPKGKTLDLPLKPYYDTLFLYSRGAARALALLGIEEKEALLLLVKTDGGIHYVYSGNILIGKINFINNNIEFKTDDPILITNSIQDLIHANNEILRILETYSSNILLNAINKVNPKQIIVPISGGKDSAVALALTTKIVDKNKVKAIYVDTGIDFPENKETVEELASKVGVELITTSAGVDYGLLAGKPLPTSNNRWCTGRKLQALNKAIKEISKNGNILLVVGDRDSESDRRSRRPIIRVDDVLPYPAVSPLRLWSGAHVLAYLWWKGLPINPLYSLGFYRTGCYLCFALRSWEINIMDEEGLIDNILKRKPWQKDFFRRFLEKRYGVNGWQMLKKN